MRAITSINAFHERIVQIKAKDGTSPTKWEGLGNYLREQTRRSTGGSYRLGTFTKKKVKELIKALHSRTGRNLINKASWLIAPVLHILKNTFYTLQIRMEDLLSLLPQKTYTDKGYSNAEKFKADVIERECQLSRNQRSQHDNSKSTKKKVKGC